MVKCKYCEKEMKKDVECNPFTGMKYEVKYVCEYCGATSPPYRDPNEAVATNRAYEFATEGDN